MPRVQILPDQVANQIAAGEVVERPASVIKELIENSIDAGSTKVEVEFKSGGKSYMRIEDNGCGMSQDDALLALERHATSKIREADDLNSIMTMGFRGEALPSIASVSRFQIQTRESSSGEGTEILVNGGKLEYVRSCGMPVGSRITISQLFNTVPARRKFLKTNATESAHIVYHTRLYALAHPEVAFTLLDNGRTLFATPSCNELKDRIGEIFGRDVSKNLLSIESKEKGMSVRGYIGAPGYSRTSRHEMLVFVNNRPVESRTLGYALMESYHGHIPKGRYPIAFLFLEIPPAQLDVNVHPAKREIRFRNEANVRGFAVRAILETLRAGVSDRQASIKPKASSLSRENPEGSRPELPVEPAVKNETGGESSPKRSEARRRLVQPAAEQSNAARVVDKPAPKEPTRSVSPPKATAAPSPSPEISSAEPAAIEAESVAPELAPIEGDEDSCLDQNWRYIGLAQKNYAIYDTDAGIVLLNTKAAQKRIHYERLLKEFANQETCSQKLLIPIPMEFDPVSSAILSDHETFLERHGLAVAPFGRNFFRVESVPDWIDEKGAEDFIREVVAMLRSGQIDDSKEDLANESIARHAASKAIRIQTQMDEEVLAILLNQLFACANPLADIDGRPTFIELSQGELKKRFQKPAPNVAMETF